VDREDLRGETQRPRFLKEKDMANTPAWQRSEGRNPEGGLNAKGRAPAKAEGHNLKPPVSSEQAKKSPKAAAETRKLSQSYVWDERKSLHLLKRLMIVIAVLILL